MRLKNLKGHSRKSADFARPVGERTTYNAAEFDLAVVERNVCICARLKPSDGLPILRYLLQKTHADDIHSPGGILGTVRRVRPQCRFSQSRQLICRTNMLCLGNASSPISSPMGSKI
jgi:hypothetical protein